MKQMMEGVVENGSAKNLKNAACKIAGKTGTAKVAAGSKGYNSEPKYRASFVGYFPADKPMYSCIMEMWFRVVCSKRLPVRFTRWHR